jgi:hypothetical protein
MIDKKYADAQVGTGDGTLQVICLQLLKKKSEPLTVSNKDLNSTAHMPRVLR